MGAFIRGGGGGYGLQVTSGHENCEKTEKSEKRKLKKPIKTKNFIAAASSSSSPRAAPERSCC